MYYLIKQVYQKIILNVSLNQIIFFVLMFVYSVVIEKIIVLNLS